MSEDGQTPPGAPPGPSAAPFEVVIDGDGSATIDGEPVPVIGDQPLDTAILDTLHGYAQIRESPVAAAISNPATGYAVGVEVGPDGSSRLLGRDADAAAAITNGATAGVAPPAANGTAAAHGGEAADADGHAAAARTGTGSTAAATPAAASGVSGGPVPPDGGASGADRRRVPSIPRPSLPRPSIPSLPRPSLSKRSSGPGGTGPRGPRGSDEEFEPGSLLKKPWVAATTAIAVAALVTTPLALAGASDGHKENGASRKHLEEPKADEGRGPSGTVRPSPPGYPTDPPSGSPSSKPSEKDEKDEKDKDPDKPKSSLSKPDEASDDEEDEEPQHETDSSGGGDHDKKISRGKPSKIPSGTTMVVNRRTGKCVDLPGTGKGKPDGRVQQGACDTSAGARGGNQRWHLDLKKKDAGPGDADLYLIRNVKDGLCLDLPAFGPVKSTTPVTEYHCRAKNDNQLWWFDKQSDGTYWIRNHKSGHLCLDVADRKKAHAHLRIVGCEDNSVQQWRFRKP
ncbi:RICIN domain-containing protein [Streptomyces spirodelae]|uniref:Ricin-type beta-trefoil lectin domain protein n=1 Tax=Streptomyces spirodelae TaxID=2812904 RepID=A0ABS3X0G9_9ACTN|nr:RICIN domain-containing protein [Streptomyces spirodelae]MBO8188884.1 ricin-type beta-trefoil lectin domain protein [Streptomyces spirodelae]